VAEFIQESVVFLVRVQCHCKESLRSLSHLLMFLVNLVVNYSPLTTGTFEVVSAHHCGYLI